VKSFGIATRKVGAERLASLVGLAAQAMALFADDLNVNDPNDEIGKTDQESRNSP
jgi:hypothetical protein